MKLLERHVNNKQVQYSFWHGYDKDIINIHPGDGSNGMMIVFIETNDLKEVQANHNNSYVAIYEVPNGYNLWDDLIRKFKQKFNQPFKGVFGIKTGNLN